MSNLTVDVETPKGVVLGKTEIPGEYTARQIVNEMVNHLNLPLLLDGDKITYSLRWLNQDQVLEMNQTLQDAGIASGDKLKLESSKNLMGDGAEPPPPPPPLPKTGAKGSDSTVQVNVLAKDVNRYEVENLELDLAVERLIVKLVEKYSMPVKTAAGPIVYYMQSKAMARTLNGSDTLRSANVPPGDSLTITKLTING